MGNVSLLARRQGDSPQCTIASCRARHKKNAPASAVAGGRARSARGPPSAQGEICEGLACCAPGKISPKGGAGRLTDEPCRAALSTEKDDSSTVELAPSFPSLVERSPLGWKRFHDSLRAASGATVCRRTADALPMRSFRVRGAAQSALFGLLACTFFAGRSGDSATQTNTQTVMPSVALRISQPPR